MNNKKGNSILITPIIIVITITMLIIVGYHMINLMLPFVYYEKLNTISNKYLFVIEKFGYLTENEKLNLINELEVEGFDSNKIILKYPDSPKPYGELIEFNITYGIMKKEVVLEGLMVKYKEKETTISVRKNSFSKINL